MMKNMHMLNLFDMDLHYSSIHGDFLDMFGGRRCTGSK
jgi:hypothetical protein